ncbi:MAG: OmpH family outer membrane protein [Nitrospiraceae bacterium]|nr:OmpH family outer membrane protein [Nitrospiraceae bacterium]
MKRFVTAALCFGFIIACSVSAAYSAELKIGVVDVFKALNESDQGKKAKIELEALIKSKQTVLEERGKTLEKLKADIEKQSALISADARKAKQDDFERQMRDYQRIASDSQAEVKKKENELTGEILKELREIILKVSKDGNYTLVLEKAQALYALDSIDVTDSVIKAYDATKTKTTK